MRKILLISPHFDDAVLSAGQLLAGRPNADVVTVFGGEPKDLDIQTDYDKKCGFKDARDALAIRQSEDYEALALLGAHPMHLAFPDSQYGEKVDKDKIYLELVNIINSNDYEFVVAPLGLSHPDHVLVSELVLDLWEETSMPFYLWEDLPTRVVYPEEVFERLKQVREIQNLELSFPGTGEIAHKIRALSCYKSQIGTGILDPYVMYVPERFWLIK